MRTARQDKVLGAAGLVGVAGHFDGAIVGRGLALDEPLRVEGARAATAVGHALGDATAVGIDEPGQIQHLAEGHGAEVEMLNLSWLVNAYGGSITESMAYCSCGARALYSQRLIEGKPAPYDSPIIVPGDAYEPRCAEHFVLPGRPH